MRKWSDQITDVQKTLVQHETAAEVLSQAFNETGNFAMRDRMQRLALDLRNATIALTNTTTAVERAFIHEAER